VPDADAAFKEALKSDPKYVKPYQSLTASSYKQEQVVRDQLPKLEAAAGLKPA